MKKAGVLLTILAVLVLSIATYYVLVKSTDRGRASYETKSSYAVVDFAHSSIKY